MGHWLHGMARRAEQIELNRSSCAEMYARVLGPLRVHGAKTQLTLAGGTEGSNPLSSAAESERPFRCSPQFYSIKLRCRSWRADQVSERPRRVVSVKGDPVVNPGNSMPNLPRITSG